MFEHSLLERGSFPMWCSQQQQKKTTFKCIAQKINNEDTSLIECVVALLKYQIH